LSRLRGLANAATRARPASSAIPVTRAVLAAWAVLASWAMAGACAAEASDPPPTRVEARSQSLLAVGVVHGEHMTIRLTRPADNSPVTDAVVQVHLRGSVHPTRAEADGSYALDSRDLAIPGPAAVQFEVAEGGASQTLTGTLEPGGPASKPDEGNSARQLWWWVLNFAVCIGFLLLLSRRRKTAEPD
jgi:hypothetical protein